MPTVTAGATTPHVAPLSAQQVVAKALATDVPGFSGTVRWSANLGIPDLGSVLSGPGSSASFTPTTLLSGDHTIEVWSAGADQQRLALPGTLSEVDFVHNGARTSYYDSTTDTVTNVIPSGGSGSHSSPDLGNREPAVTPDQIAARLLTHLTPTTTVHVAAPVFVAGHPTYLLVLAPAAGTKGAAVSTVRQITIAIDTATGMPLRVQVYARGQSAPALQIGFKKVSFHVPAASQFAPLSGAHTQTSKIGGGAAGGHRAAGSAGFGFAAVTGPDWGATATFAHVDLGRSGRQISDATVPVSGAFGTARLLQTSLVNALIFPDGRVVAGFVTPSALEAASVSGSR